MFLRVAYFCLVFVAEITVLPAQETNPAAVANASEFQVSGTLVDADSGQPLPHARVSLALVTKRDEPAVLVTGDDGRFLFHGLAAGKYTLSAQARGHLLQSFNQHDQFSSSIVLGPNIEGADLIFKLPADNSISGTVIDEAGEPVRNAAVSLYFTGVSAGVDATRTRGRTMTNDEGEYHFSHLASGRYLVAVSARPWYAQVLLPTADSPVPAGEIVVEAATSSLDVAYPVTFYGGAEEASAATTIKLARGERFTANFVLQPVPALHLRFATAQNSSGGTYITLEQHVLDGPAIQLSAESRAVGQDSMETAGVPPGHYTVKIHAVGKNITDNAYAQEIDINGSGGLQRPDSSIYASVAASISGDAADLPKQLSVRLLNKKSQEPITEHVDDQGEAVFKQGILPGSYEVSLFSNGGTYLKTLAAEGAKIAGRTVDIKPGAAVKLKIGIAHGFGNIDGVALRNNKPVAGMMVVLVPPDPAHSHVLFRRDQSDSDGTFSMPNVVPGNYTMLAIENGWDLEWMNPAVLRNYLGHGIPVVVQPNGKLDLKVTVQ